MYAANDVTQVRNSLAKNIGSKVMLETNKGKQKSLIVYGTIENTYPSIFTVMLDDAEDIPGRTVSYGYADILTKNIEITVFNS